MTRARTGAIAAILVLLIGAAAVLGRSIHAPQPSLRADKPRLLLLTSLPLMFNEDFSIEGGGSEALSALGTRYRVVPISVTDAADLAKGRLLLMAHPAAQTAENLVELDQWVRSGGRVLLLADPMLEWPSRRPLGDPLRPSPMFADTGLLGHWGLRLDAPDTRGVTLRMFGSKQIETVSPGSLFGDCDIGRDHLVARCHIGKGRATIVADADFLNIGALDGPTDNNLPALIAELSALQN